MRAIALTTIKEREAFFMALYKKVFPVVARYVSRRGGNEDDAADIFQDSVVIYYEKVVSGDMDCKDEQAYLMGICKNLWLKRFNNGKNLPFNEQFDDLIAEDKPVQPAVEKLMHYLENAGQKCMNLLRAFYYDQLPLKDIAALLGYSGERSATVQKYKCLEKVRATVKQKALQYEDFVE
ncbi:sigma-70 family RNA polymerase sigma factor [Mucilaginibacter sp. RS28]|uniref:Sigma-70 family RNA polymerase sigma factor n=1 Tax=Mucilaginibacter straminoryzae TaxID=2932774 RepID=A0A9X2BBP8_9SPHI|nr:sigma-70 family RNA polymerase sigma factor [Mucilaginibacter straminoryzae]MCJ8210077.1 sigma-70 family RNA polymerase sigma factor [Mucilaginibacter straminoryzae]